METIDKVIAAIREHKENCPEIHGGSDLRNELDIDSFDTIMIINAIEDEFSIEFDGKHIEKIRTVNDIVTLLNEKYLNR
ncbi:MAG: acyl carrier protein [Eudoraea sp.]|nr:acyl carrier protein [Eudoraea sp.]